MTGYLRVRRSDWCHYRNTLKQQGTRQSQQRCWHISAMQPEPAGVREKARHQTTLKYLTRGGKKKLSSSNRGSANMRRFMVCSLNVSQEEAAKLKSKRPKNKRSKWISEEHGGISHASLRLFSSESNNSLLFICSHFNWKIEVQLLLSSCSHHGQAHMKALLHFILMKITGCKIKTIKI